MIKSILKALGLIKGPQTSVYYNAQLDEILFVTHVTVNIRRMETIHGKTSNPKVVEPVLKNSIYLGVL